MNIMLNNPVLYVVDYPNVDAVEVIDKRRGVGGLFRDEAARRFRQELRELSASATQMDDFENWIADRDALMTQPAIYH
ncbi:hypothetical protein [Zoogloea sp.]|jgi:hypothetical protein|uniref:hypothetical protein n=1 Tax=Zoogloea sp. TaxID=49181 RepID=UPI0011D683AA|nr:hypothetical protein [Zoogloea sp.]MBN8281849.1 hypothetical protein [Zoogloea sp.]TXG97785.1 MAG: hypothetical protein E6R15_02830 [Zoogloea sp.]HOY02243.1 hypothetical protein [Zoogloea sp.]HRH72624.1 hypothetical protein [Zoogloea sp.]